VGAARPLQARVLARYALFQAPGWVVAATIAFAADYWGLVPTSWAVAAVVLWFAKDVVLFPFVRRAYERDGPTHGAIGERGTADGAIESEGWVRIGPELWRARLRSGAAPIQARAPIRVVAVEGLELVVEPDPGDLPPRA